jgi:flagellar protein FliO/FliZ
MSFARRLLMLLESRRSGPRPLLWLLWFFRVLRAMAAGLLFSHAGAYSQAAVAPAAATAAASQPSAPLVLPRTIPFRPDSSSASSDGNSSPAAIALVVLSGLAGFAWWAWRRSAQSSGAEGAGKGMPWWRAMPSRKSVLLHGSTRLSPKHSVHEIEWRGRRLLIGCADQAMTLLAEHVVAESPESSVVPDHAVPAAPAEDKP